MTVHNDCPKCISDSHYGQSLWRTPNFTGKNSMLAEELMSMSLTILNGTYEVVSVIQSSFLSAIMTVQIRLFSLWLSNGKSEFLSYNVIMTRCSRHTGFNVRPRATKTVLGLRLLRSLQSSDSFGGTRADIKPSMPRAAGSLYPINVQNRK